MDHIRDSVDLVDELRRLGHINEDEVVEISEKEIRIGGTPYTLEQLRGIIQNHLLFFNPGEVIGTSEVSEDETGLTVQMNLTDRGKEIVDRMNRGIVRISDIVDPDAPMTVGENGGKQSDIPVRFDLIDAKAMFEMAKVLDHGAKKYGANNWRLIPVDEHLNHLLMHTYAYLAGDDTDDHLSHILCRATFALGVKLADEE